MFLALLYSLIIHQTVTLANPLHKYPYVYLLDIGNEELQTKSEQIRVSVPGGSLALKYPATGEGDSIAHVRVSGIDFDNDLKASIVDGGPGYKYVVIVFMGNPGRVYDAVVTVSTLDDEKSANTEDTDLIGADEVKSSYKVTEGDGGEYNDNVETQGHDNDESIEQLTSASNVYGSAENADDEEGRNTENTDPIDVNEVKSTYRVTEGDEEDFNESAETQGHDNVENIDQLPSASNFYDSAENADYNGKEDESGEDINVNSRTNGKFEEHPVNSESVDVQDYADAIDQNEDNDYDDAHAPREENYSVNEEYATDDVNKPSTKELDRNLYYKYNALRPHLYGYAKVPQEINNEENEVDYKVENYDNGVVYYPEDPVELDQMFNDEEVHNDGNKYSDPNNNNYANSEISAVAY